MPRKFIVARMPMADAEAKKKLLDMLSKACDHALTKEPGLQKYAVCLPRDELDSNVIYVIEEYADDAAFQDHVATEGIKDLRAWFSSGSCFDGHSELNMLQMTDGLHFSRPDVKSAQDPHILFVELMYQPGGVEKSMPYWQTTVDACRNDEPGTWVYTILKDPKNENRLCVLEAYESPEYLTGVHFPSKAVQTNLNETKDLRTAVKHTKLKMIMGFLHKD